MGSVTVRPNSNNGASGWTPTGGTLHGVLADDNDATYLASTPTPNLLTLGFPAPTIPAGAMVKNALLLIKTARTGGPAGLVAGAFLSAGASQQFAQQPNWPSPQSVWVATLVPSSGPLNITNLALHFQWVHQARLHEASAVVVYVLKPVVNVTGPTGTLTTNNRPTLTWTETLDEQGGNRVFAQVRVYDASTHGGFGSVNPSVTVPLVDSGLLTGGPASWRVPQPLDDDNYRAYVRVAQVVNGVAHWSDWNNTNFEIDVDRPGIPTVSPLGEDEFARVSLQLTETAGAANTDWWEIQGSPDGTDNWQNILTAAGDGSVPNPNPGGSGTQVIGDYEPANSEARFYRARAVTDHGNDVTVTSDWSDPESANWTSRLWWLKHRTLAGLNMPVVIASQPGWQRESRDGPHLPLGSSDVVVTSDKVGPKRGEITFMIDSELDRERLGLLLESLDPILIQAVPGGHWTDRWVRLSNHESRPGVDKTQVTTTLDRFDWIEVSRPD